MSPLSRIAIATVLGLAGVTPSRGAELSMRPQDSAPFAVALPGASSGSERRAAAAEPVLHSDPIQALAPRGLPEFVATYVSPRLDARLAPLGARIPTADWDRMHRDPATWESMARAVETDSRRAVESAARGYLIEKTGLDRVAVTIARNSAGAARGAQTGTAPAVRLRLGFSGIVPRMDCSVPAGRGEFRFQVAARGDVTLRYDGGKARGVSVGAGLDPIRGQYGVSLLGRF